MVSGSVSAIDRIVPRERRRASLSTASTVHLPGSFSFDSSNVAVAATATFLLANSERRFAIAARSWDIVDEGAESGF
jgi:hypothetical protein